MIKMLIWDQNKPIWLILKNKNKKFKNPQFVNCMFIISKNENNTVYNPF